jgi:hypothetical protein
MIPSLAVHCARSSRNTSHEPHDYQLDGCPVMDGYDLLATTPTGSGKTGFLFMLMLVVPERFMSFSRLRFWP